MSKELGKILSFRIGYWDGRVEKGDPAILTTLSLSGGGQTQWRQPLSDLRGLLTDAKAIYADQMVGKPIEAELDDNALVSWRILKEVL